MTKQFDNIAITKVVLQNSSVVHLNLPSEELIKSAIRQPEVSQTVTGTIVARTGEFTGRSPGDKFIVEDALTKDSVWWGNTGKVSAKSFNLLMSDMLAEITGKSVYYQQLQAGADVKKCYNVDVFSPSAWHSLFIQNLLIEPNSDRRNRFQADVSIIHLPEFKASPKRHGCKTETCIALDLSRNIVLICGTAYAGEIKKSVFSLFNFHAPADDILPMHCSANVGQQGDTALFFGLSGTGKTTLSSSPDRALVGDDEHGWSTEGIFNLEGGCYAKAINLTAAAEPEIFEAAKFPGAVMENVVLDPQTGEPDYEDSSLTENTRIAYPLTAIPNRVDSGIAPTPQNVVLLTADAFGVLPPIARLTREQAIYYFLSGYTAKVAGTERGVVEPQATFSTCFGAPFMARFPDDYGDLLNKRLRESGAQCWLLNTGWTGGAYGVGKRMPLATTRRILDAALSGELDDTNYRVDDIFKLEVPTEITGVDVNILDPEKTWSDTAAFKKQAEELLKLFEDNYINLAKNDI